MKNIFSLKPRKLPSIWKGRLRELKRLYRTDMSIEEIAKQLHVGRTTLQQKIRELGLKRPPRIRKKEIDEKLLKDLVKMGVPSVKIAEKLHIHTSTLAKHKKRLGIFCKDKGKTAIGKKGAACRSYYKEAPECPHKKNILEKYKNVVIPLLEDGVSKIAIARRYGVCVSTVYNFIHLYGLKAPVKKICDDREEQIIEAYTRGKSLENISEQLSCCTNTIRRKLNELELSRPKGSVIKESILNDQKDLVEKLYKQGLSGQEIAEILNVSMTSIYCCIRRFKFSRVQKRAGWSVFKGHDEELLQMRKSGMTLKEIGKQFGVRDTCVLERLKKLNRMDEANLNV